MSDDSHLRAMRLLERLLSRHGGVREDGGVVMSHAEVRYRTSMHVSCFVCVGIPIEYSEETKNVFTCVA